MEPLSEYGFWGTGSKEVRGVSVLRMMQNRHTYFAAILTYAGIRILPNQRMVNALTGETGETFLSRVDKLGLRSWDLVKRFSRGDRNFWE